MDIELILDTQAHEKHNDKGNKLPLKPHSKIVVSSGARMFSSPHAQGQETSNTQNDTGNYHGLCSRNFAPLAPQSRSAFDLFRFRSPEAEEAAALLLAFKSSSSVR